MYFRLMGKLNARRQAILQGEEAEKGFTLIELLVVVIIIGILAAIAIPIYIGISNNAKDSAVKSDLTNVKTAVVAAYTNNNTWTLPTGSALAPATVVDSTTTPATTLGSLGATSSANYGTGGQAPTAFTGSNTTTFCIDAKSADTGTAFHISASSGVASGACSSTAG